VTDTSDAQEIPAAVRPRISVAFLDFPGNFNPDRIRKLIEMRYEVVLNEDAPDYVVYSVFGSRFLKYPEAVRIFFTGENVHPDFNLCDYAFGYDYLEFGERYYRCPNYQLYDQFKELCARRHSPPPPDLARRRFANFIYSNRNAHPLRDEFFVALCRYRNVDSPGRHLQNCNDPIGAPYSGDWSSAKVAYQRKFKFSFAFENSSTRGYTTEKIVHALAADTIPIYWGNPEIGREFNVRRIVNCHAFGSMKEVLDHIMAIDHDDALYNRIVAEPYFPDDRMPEELQDDRVLKQFGRVFDQPKAAAFRRNLHAWGVRYEAQRKIEVEAAECLHGRGILPWLTRRILSSARKSSAGTAVDR
jgi:hypothetical protein